MSDPDRGPQLRGVLAAVIAVVMFAGVVALVLDGEEGVPASGARVQVDGVVLVVHADGSSSPLEDGDIVLGGEEVRVQSGSVVMELASGAMLEGREGADEVASTRVRIGESPELIAGDLLMRGSREVVVGAGGNDVTYAPAGGDGAARIRRALSVTVGSYRGAAELDSAGQERTVPALRQLSVAALGRPPAAPDPLRIDATDGWDLRYLGVAFELTRRLDALSQTYTSNFGSAGATPEAIVTILPELTDEPTFGPDLLTEGPGGNRPGGETLVGVAIALLGRGGDFDDRFGDVRAFRDDGAEWGLVALDQGVPEGVLVDMVEAAFGRAGEPTGEVAAPAAAVVTDVPSAPASVPGQGGGAVDGEGTTGSTPAGESPDAPIAPSSPTIPPTTLPPPTLPPPPVTIPPGILPPPPDEGVLPDTGVPLLDDLVEPVDDILGGILGG